MLQIPFLIINHIVTFHHSPQKAAEPRFFATACFPLPLSLLSLYSFLKLLAIFFINILEIIFEESHMWQANMDILSEQLGDFHPHSIKRLHSTLEIEADKLSTFLFLLILSSVLGARVFSVLDLVNRIFTSRLDKISDAWFEILKTCTPFFCLKYFAWECVLIRSKIQFTLLDCEFFQVLFQ